MEKVYQKKLEQSQNSKIEGVWEKIYPVGSIYMSTSATNPKILFGGTWEQIQGRFLLGAGSGYAAGSSGGEATHSLTAAEIPIHAHGIDYMGAYGASSGSWGGFVATSGTGITNTHATGGGAAHNNMPPYLVVYVWKRIA